MKKFLIFFVFTSVCFADLQICQMNENNKGIEVYENVSGYQHHDGLWFQTDKHLTYFSLANYLHNNFIKKNNFKRILELGSGAGSLAFFLRQMDPSLIVVTIDGNKETCRSPYVKTEHHFIARTDEDLEFFDGDNNRIFFDFVISFEHFEHIQHERFHILLNNIKKHINEKTLCFCSAANWGGPGIYEPHCNVKTLDEWEDYLMSQGFEILDTKSLKGVPSPFNFDWDSSHKLLFRLSKGK